MKWWVIRKKRYAKLISCLAMTCMLLSAAVQVRADQAEAPKHFLARGEMPEAILQMGKLIFNDTRFSSSGNVSCRSCHRPEYSFSGGDAVVLRGDGTSPVLSPAPLFNLNMKIGFFSYQPVFSLAEAVERCVEQNLQASSLELYAVLRKDRTLSRYASEYFGRISSGAVYRALAAYLYSIRTGESRYDRYRQGMLGALTAEEQQGMVLFEQKGCHLCHNGPEMGGMVYIENPAFSDDISVPQKLQVPRLRNLNAVKPYLHDGSATRLADVIRLMGQRYTNAGLSEGEVDKIRLFLLSNESYIRDFEGPVTYDNQR